ncbi:MAG: PAS domain S-box protein [Deltaproteobacteria bacterium]|nr:PAS domain S-box protein [Deltaproteobacteria bacterium]
MAFLVALLLLFCGSFGTGLAQSQPPADLTGKNVLILHSYEVNTPVFVRTDSGLSTALQSGGVPSLNQFYESLDLRRNPGPEHRKMLVEQMRMRYGHHRKPDMIVTMYPEALDFVLNDCRTDLPDVPILAIVLPVGFELPETDRRIIAHFARLDILGTVEIAMKMVPGAKRVYVVGGDHKVDRSVEAQARRDLRKWESRLEFVYLSRMPFEEMLAVVSGAPPDSIILSLAFSRDVNGKNYTTPIVNKRLSEVSRAPIFGILDHTLGHGIAGGNLTSFELIGNKAGYLVLDILGGTKTPDELPAVLDVPPVPMFDWRQLRRWNLDEDALPKGSIVINRETTLRDYKYYILGFLVFCILETALIALLLLQRRKKTEAEASLRKKTEELDQFFNVNLDLLCIANAEGYFLRLNPAMERVLGYHCEELMSRPFLDFVHPDDVNKTREALSSLKSQKELLSFENRYRGKDGAYRYLQWNAAPSGDMIYAAARDITDKISIESETRKLREDLAHVTRVSTLGELTSSLAHEINQPLAAILSNAQAAQRFLSQGNPDMKEIAEILGDIIRDDNRAAEVIRKIRALLKKEETRFEALSVNDVAEEILNVVRNDTALAALTIERVFDSSLPAVWGDRIQLQQVILNLVMNAAEAMRDGSPDRQMLTVKTSKRDERFAEVSVMDTGPGIDGKAGNRLFEPFYTTKSGGLGMGLAISRHIVASHKGEIRAVNNPNRGATVSFTIPFDNGGNA